MTYTDNNPLRVFEAFAGYGSQAMALHRLAQDYPGFKFEVVGISEIEKNALAAYDAVHGHCPNFGSITDIDWSQVPDFDLLTYSFPCQDISNAGHQRGFSEGTNTRSSLLWDCLKGIEIKRPKYLLMENVKALVQKKFKPDFQKLQDRLSAMGYVNFWQVLNAKDFGVAQNRERVFMVSILQYSDTPPCYQFPNGWPLDKCVEDYMEPAEDVPESYYVNQDRITRKVLEDILDQPHVREEMEKFYHEQWCETDSD